MEYDDLQQKNEMLEKALVSVRDELSTVHRERGRLEAAVKTSTAQEEHHKRCIFINNLCVCVSRIHCILSAVIFTN